MWQRHAHLLPQGGERTVVVLAADQSPERVNEVLDVFVDDEVHVFSPRLDPEWQLDRAGAAHHSAPDLWAINRRLGRLGPVDVLLDLQPGSTAEHELRWSTLFFHLADGGAWMVPRWAIGRAAGEGFASMARVAQAVAGDTAAVTGHLERELTLATSMLVMASDATIVVKRGEHLLKIHEQRAQRLLSTREPQLEVATLATLPRVEVVSEMTVDSHDLGVPQPDLGTTFTVPAMQLRHYRGDVAVVSNCLAYAGASALPESFRHPFEHNLRSTRLLPVNASFGRIEDESRPRRHLPGTYYHLDASNSGHFGHLLTEVLSRLWGWPVAKQQIPGLKAIFRIRFPDERDPVLEKRLFTAFGIEEADVVWVDEPVRVDGLVGATPMMHNKEPFYIHPEIRQRIWEPITESLRQGRAGVGPRVFVSRKPGGKNRSCTNGAEVQETFAQHGFALVYPEDHDLAEQAAIFHDAEVVAGFGGSGLFNVMHCANLRHLIVLNSTSYTARNEQLYAAALGSRVHYFWNQPEVPQHAGTWSHTAYISPWQFDFSRHRVGLEALWDEIG